MWPAYVINLAANTPRLAAVRQILDRQGIAFTRIEAVNGWALTPPEIARVYDAARNARDGRQPLVPAEIGCYLSHIAAWDRIATGPAPGGFVFEDDFDATPDLARVLAALSVDTVGDWDMVKLFTLDPAAPVGMVRELARDLAGDLLPGVRIGIPYRVPTCLIGYGLTRAAAAGLLARALPFFRPVDEDQKFVWDTGLRVALVQPAPVVLGDQQTVTGTVGRARRAGRRRGLGQLLHQLRYAWRYRTALARHRRREGWQL